jgi:putative ABC transport system permease protein
MTCCLLIGLYVQNELSFDRFHEKSDRIYRVVQESGDGDGGLSRIGDAIMPILKDDLSGVEAAVRINESSAEITVDGEAGPQAFQEDDLVYADSSLFEVFDFALRQGRPDAVLAEPASVVLSVSAAERYFGTPDAVGRTLTLGGDYTVTVTGVMEEVPANSHVQFDVVASFPSFYAQLGYPSDQVYGSFWWPQAWTYVLLEPGTDAAAFSEVLDETVDDDRRPEVASAYDATLQPLADIHLYSEGLSRGVPTRGSLANVMAFAAVALFVLVIACVNFVNLATARAAERSREVGVRKSLGAESGQLVRQFVGEALVLSTAAVALALGATALLRPLLAEVAGRALAVGVLGNPWLWGGAAAVVAVAGLGAGLYPALFLARYQPADVLQDAGTGGRSRAARLRQGLVVFQFAVSVVLIVGGVVAYQQLTYMQTAKLGFEKEAVVALGSGSNYPSLRRELERRPEVQAVVGASTRPGLDGGSDFRYEVNGRRPGNEEERLNIQHVDFGFFEMLDVEVLAGRRFEAPRSGDLGRTRGPDDTHAGLSFRDRALVVNRSLANKFGWGPEEAVGQRLRFYTIENGTYYQDIEGEVIGVVEDYHAVSLRNEIPPIAYAPSKIHLPADEPDEEPGTGYYLLTDVLVKLAPGTGGAGMEAVRDTWSEVNPDEPFQAAFLDEALDRLYESERRVGRLVGFFSLLAVFVACLGLFGLAAHTARQRIREIGVRKALGASVTSIVGMLSGRFLVLVGIAVAVGGPVAYLLAREWLTGFAYRVDLGPVPFLIAAGTAVLIALATVSTQALRAARISPAEVLRSE